MLDDEVDREMVRFARQLLIDSDSDSDSDADLYNWEKFDAALAEDQARVERIEAEIAAQRQRDDNYGSSVRQSNSNGGTNNRTEPLGFRGELLNFLGIFPVLSQHCLRALHHFSARRNI